MSGIKGFGNPFQFIGRPRATAPRQVPPETPKDKEREEAADKQKEKSRKNRKKKREGGSLYGS